MPIVDMPLSELKNYKGINPKPKDFDEFWDKSLAELDKIDPKVELKKAEFQTSFADCFDMYYTSTFGARIYAKLLIPKEIKGKCPAMLDFHGYTGSSCMWTNYLPYVAEGFIVAGMDCRGQGGKSEDVGGVTGNTFRGHIIRGLDDEPEKLLFRNIFLDTAMLARIILARDDVDETRVGVRGGSQGGGLATVCAALEPRIAQADVQYPFLSDYKRVWEMDLMTPNGAYAEIRDYFRWYDVTHKREEEVFTKLGYIDIQNLAKRIKADFTMYTGLMDTTCPPSTQFAMYNKLTCPKKTVIYPDFGHEGLGDIDDVLFTSIMKLKG